MILGEIHMNSNLDKFKGDLAKIITESEILYYSMADELNLLDENIKKTLKEKNVLKFTEHYEIWYSESYQLIKQILPDRLNDFLILYKNDKRKEIDFCTYTISDYLIGLQTTRGDKVIADGRAALPKFKQQMNIVKSAEKRFESTLFDIKQILQADIFDNELETTLELHKNGFLRAAGAVAGVVLERHLNSICNTHNIKIQKKNPTINDYNELLKNNNIIEVHVWRNIQFLGDIRNLCDHNKEREPSKEEVNDLITGVKKTCKTIF